MNFHIFKVFNDFVKNWCNAKWATSSSSCFPQRWGTNTMQIWRIAGGCTNSMVLGSGADPAVCSLVLHSGLRSRCLRLRQACGRARNRISWEPTSVHAHLRCTAQHVTRGCRGYNCHRSAKAKASLHLVLRRFASGGALGAPRPQCDLSSNARSAHKLQI